MDIISCNKHYNTNSIQTFNNHVNNESVNIKNQFLKNTIKTQKKKFVAVLNLDKEYNLNDNSDSISEDDDFSFEMSPDQFQEKIKRNALESQKLKFSLEEEFADFDDDSELSNNKKPKDYGFEKNTKN